MNAVCWIFAVASIAACSGHAVSTSTTTAGTTKALLIDAPFPYNQVARVDVYIVSVAASTKPDTLGSGGPGTIATPHRAYNLLELGNGSAAELGEGILPAGPYVQFFVTIDGDSSSSTLQNGTVGGDGTVPSAVREPRELRSGRGCTRVLCLRQSACPRCRGIDRRRDEDGDVSRAAQVTYARYLTPHQYPARGGQRRRRRAD